MDSINILISSSAGVYVPQRFAKLTALAKAYDLSTWSDIDPEDLTIIEQGPDHESYWDAWNNILNSATYQYDGLTYHLHQDGDLYAICYETITDEEYENFFGEPRS